MNIALWIVAGVLAFAFLAAGMLKVSQPKQALKEKGLDWVDDFPSSIVKVIGLLEVLAAIGLILPSALDIAPILVPLAATGLVIVMAGAIVTHARRKEPQMVIVNVVLLALAAFVAWGRFGPHSF